MDTKTDLHEVAFILYIDTANKVEKKGSFHLEKIP